MVIDGNYHHELLLKLIKDSFVVVDFHAQHAFVVLLKPQSIIYVICYPSTAIGTLI